MALAPAVDKWDHLASGILPRSCPQQAFDQNPNFPTPVEAALGPEKLFSKQVVSCYACWLVLLRESVDLRGGDNTPQKSFTPTSVVARCSCRWGGGWGPGRPGAGRGGWRLRGGGPLHPHPTPAPLEARAPPCPEATTNRPGQLPSRFSQSCGARFNSHACSHTSDEQAPAPTRRACAHCLTRVSHTTAACRDDAAGGADTLR